MNDAVMTTYHEASHAVVGHALGMICEGIDLYWSGDELAQATYHHAWRRGQVPADAAECVLCVAVASTPGEILAAQYLGMRGYAWNHHAQDEQQLDAPDADLTRAKCAAYDILVDHWPAVVCVARALMESYLLQSGGLRGRYVEDMLRGEVWGRNNRQRRSERRLSAM